MATHSSTLAWKLPWTEEPSKVQSTEVQRVRHDWATSLHFTSKYQLHTCKMSGTVLNHWENMKGKHFLFFKAYSTALSDFDSDLHKFYQVFWEGSSLMGDTEAMFRANYSLTQARRWWETQNHIFWLLVLWFCTKLC